MGPRWSGKTKKLGYAVASFGCARFAKDPRIEVGLREFIAEAEDRLEMLESRHKQKLP
jgi:hypothetical protein